MGRELTINLLRERSINYLKAKKLDKVILAVDSDDT